MFALIRTVFPPGDESNVFNFSCLSPPFLFFHQGLPLLNSFLISVPKTLSIRARFKLRTCRGNFRIYPNLLLKSTCARFVTVFVVKRRLLIDIRCKRRWAYINVQGYLEIIKQLGALKQVPGIVEIPHYLYFNHDIYCTNIIEYR